MFDVRGYDGCCISPKAGTGFEGGVAGQASPQMREVVDLMSSGDQEGAEPSELH